MSATEIIRQIEALPESEQNKIANWLRDRALRSFDEMCDISDCHSTVRQLTEEEIVARASGENPV